MSNHIKAVLNGAADFFEEDTQRWIQGTYCDARGRRCAIGAIELVCSLTSPLARRFEAQAAVEQSLALGIVSLGVWNDRRERTVEDVIAALRKAAGEQV